jgi:hypothetical protein
MGAGSVVIAGWSCAGVSSEGSPQLAKEKIRAKEMNLILPPVIINMQ